MALYSVIQIENCADVDNKEREKPTSSVSLDLSRGERQF
jgi:hypothetical protein